MQFIMRLSQQQISRRSSRLPYKLQGRGEKIALAFVGVLGMLAISRRRRKWPLVMLVVVLGAAGAGSLSGCGSGGPTSPAGVYEVTVTATSGTLTHTASLALQVK
jgi:hypothetical protein